MPPGLRAKQKAIISRKERMSQDSNVQELKSLKKKIILKGLIYGSLSFIVAILLITQYKIGLKNQQFVAGIATTIGIVAVIMIYKALVEWYRAIRRTESCSGLITHTGLGKVPGKHGWIYHVEVAYQYMLDGRTYTGQHQPGFSQHNSMLIHNRTMARYSTGKAITVYYDPDNPGNAGIKSPTPYNIPNILYIICSLVLGVSLAVYADFLLIQ